MAASSAFEAILQDHGVSPQLSSHLIAEGWTQASFGCCATDVTGVDQALDEIFNAESLTLLQRSTLKAVFKACQQVATPQSSTPTLASAVDSAWHETFAPKLDPNVIKQLKQEFLKNYPSEILTPETTPSTRLLSLVYKHVKSKS